MDLETLSVSLKLVSDQFRAGIAQVKQDVAGLKGNLAEAQQHVKNFGKSLTDIGKNLTAKVTAPIVGFGLFAVKQASDLNEAMSATKTTYGDGADFIIKKSQDSANAVGLSQEEYLSAAAQLGVFGKAAGLTGKDMGAFGADTIKAAADLASFYNAPVPEALDAIRSGLTGEVEPLRRFGILINEATLKEYAYANGIAERGSELTEQQKVLARQGYILANLGAAQDDFSRTSGGLANQQRILKARFTDIAATIGQQLLPVALDFANHISALFDRIEKLSPSMLRWGIIIAGVAAAIGPLLIIVGQIAIGISALMPIFAALLGPIGLVVAAIVLLGVAYKKNWLGFGDAVRSTVKHVAKFYKQFKQLYQLFRQLQMGRIEAAFHALGIMLTNLTGIPLVDFFDRMGHAVKRFIDPVSKLADGFKKLFAGDISGGLRQIAAAIGDFLSAGPKLIGDFLKSISTGFAPLDAILRTVGKLFTDYGRLIQEIFQGDWQGALDVAVRMIGHFRDLVLQALDLLWIGIQAFFTKIDWGALFRAGIDKLGDLGGWLLDKGEQLLRGLWNGAVAFWGSTVWPWLQGLPGRALDAVPVLADVLFSKGKSLLQGLRNGIGDKWNNSLKPWLGGLASRALSAVPDLLSTLLQKGKDLITGAWNGIKAIWSGGTGSGRAVGGTNSVSGWLGELGAKAFRAVGKVLDALLQKGKDLIQGLWDGITLRFFGVAAWFKTLGTRIKNMLVDAAGWLYQAGLNIIAGMKQGLLDAAGGLYSTARGIANEVAGILKEPWKLFSPSHTTRAWGQAIGEGLALGLTDSVSMVTNAANRLSEAGQLRLASGAHGMAAATAGTGAGGTASSTVTNNFYISNPDPKATADEVFRVFSRQLSLRGAL